MDTRLRYKFVTLFLFVGIATWLWGVNYPFVGIYNANNNYLSLAAKNYLRFGFTRLGFLPTYFAGKVLPNPVPYYLHHPTLIFPLSTFPFMVFGFQNWVVHATNFFFLLGDIGVIYLIGSFVWNKRVGLWAAGLAAIFPMAGFFWKYIFFEQGSMFLNLLAFYFFIKYLSNQKRAHLFAIFLFSYLSGLIDWGVLYFFLPLLIFVFSKYAKVARVAFAVYGAAAGVSLASFIVQVYIAQHGLTILTHAVGVRAIAGELTSLPFWPIRLIAISIIRTGLYFTPFAFVSGWFAYKHHGKGFADIPSATLLSFFIFGVLNIVFLPTATWGHSYFLFYLIPFFAFVGALWFAAHENAHKVIFTWTVIIILSSVAVNYLKLQQVTKQLWKYDAAAAINQTLTPYETIGVVNFAGDVLENYFFHPTRAMTPDEANLWTSGRLNQDVDHTVFTCAGTCTTAELESINRFKLTAEVRAFTYGGNTAWVVTRTPGIVAQHILQPAVEPSAVTPAVNEGSVILRFYRILRDTLNVGQI